MSVIHNTRQPADGPDEHNNRRTEAEKMRKALMGYVGRKRPSPPLQTNRTEAGNRKAINKAKLNDNVGFTWVYWKEIYAKIHLGCE